MNEQPTNPPVIQVERSKLMALTTGVKYAFAFKFEISQRVNIVEIDRPGVVTGMMIDRDGGSYRVAYWNDGVRRHEWLYDFELTAIRAR